MLLLEQRGKSCPQCRGGEQKSHPSTDTFPECPAVPESQKASSVTRAEVRLYLNTLNLSLRTVSASRSFIWSETIIHFLQRDGWEFIPFPSVPPPPPVKPQTLELQLSFLLLRRRRESEKARIWEEGIDTKEEPRKFFSNQIPKLAPWLPPSLLFPLQGNPLLITVNTSLADQKGPFESGWPPHKIHYGNAASYLAEPTPWAACL